MKKIIIANWKMNPQSAKEAERLFRAVAQGIRGVKNVDVIIAPPFVYLESLNAISYKLQVHFGAQDCFWEDRGAYTGEISPVTLKTLGVRYVIVGHSERRAHLGETDEMINKKIKAALKAGLIPVVCIGERERNHLEDTLLFLKGQLKKDFDGIKPSAAKKIIVAYEPIWAIGTGKAENSDDAQKIAVYIKRVLQELLNAKAALAIRIIYGGSVSAKNAASFVKGGVRGMEGLLVGGASLQADEFVKIVRSVALQK
ncbi:triose-phosphate isomerase [Patescibacteria group bacterium]|nr:triose-phosphate isomerase [Patescibacteria group bacterium]